MKLKNIICLSGLLAVTGAFVASCNDQWDDHTKVSGTVGGTVLAAIESNTDLSVFCGMLKNQTVAGQVTYADLLSGNGNYTVLAPTNDALAALPVLDTATIIENHVARLSYRDISSDARLLMMNGKILSVSDAGLESEFTVCGNGALYVASNAVLPKLSLYEMLVADSADYEMARLIVEAGESVMDMEKSVQVGVDPSTGQAIYDTVWMEKNVYLDSLHIDNEDSLYTLVLLENDNFKTLQKKYVKYMLQLNDDKDSTKSYAVAASSLIYDLVCRPSESAALTSAYTDVAIDMSAATTLEQEASNGILLKTTGANIRMKNNKIKEIIVEGEDYIYSGSWNSSFGGHTYTRLRDYASGGRDVMLSGHYIQSKDFTIKASDGVTDSTYTRNYTFSYKSATNDGFIGRCNQKINAYLNYRPHLYSCPYRVYCVTYDDIAAHYAGDTLDLDWSADMHPNTPCTSIYRVIQKIFFAKEGERLNWNNGAIENAKNHVMVGYDATQYSDAKPTKGVNAGYLPEAVYIEDEIVPNAKNPALTKLTGLNARAGETPFRWHAAINSDELPFCGITDKNSFQTSVMMTNHRDHLVVKNECDMDLFVTNSWNVAATNSKENGSIYLDYIRFEPVFTEDE